MDIKQKLFICKKKQQIINKWYELVKPIGNYLLKREEKKYQKMKDRIDEKQAVKWFAECIINYIIRYPNESFALVIAKWISEDDYSSGYYCIADYSFTNLLKKKKHRAAYSKFNKDFQFQESIVDNLKTKKGIVVNEKIEEFEFSKLEDYQKTYFIKLEQ